MTIAIKNSDFEGELQIKTIIPIRIPKILLILFVLFSIITLGMFALFSKWSIKFKYWFLYKKCDIKHATHFAIITNTESFNIVDAQYEKSGDKFVLYFVFKLLKYYYNEENHNEKFFEANDFKEINTKTFGNIISSYLNGLSSEKYSHQRIKFGENLKEIPIPNIFEYLFHEMTAPFFILQYFSAMIWIMQEVYVYAIVLLVISFILTIVGYFFCIILYESNI